MPRLLSGVRGDGRGRVLAFVAAGWFLTLGLRYVVPALLPAVKDAFSLGNAGAGLAVTIVWAFYAVMQFPAGGLVDRVGERRLLAVSLVAAAGSLAVLAAAPSFFTFLVGCAVFGLATGIYGPPRGTVLSRTFPGNDGTAFGITLATGSVGSAILPLLTGVFVGSLGWRTTLLTAIPLFCLVAVGTWRVVPARASTPDADTDRSYAAVARDAAAAVRTRRVAAPVAAVTFLLFGLQGFTAFVPTYLVDVRGYPSSTAAAVFALFFVVGAISQFAAGALADRFGKRAVLIAVTTAAVVPLAALPYTHGLLPVAAAVGLAGVRLAMAPLSNAYIIDSLPENVQGLTWGGLRTGFFVLSATGSLFVGALGDRGLFDASFLVLAALTAVGALCYLALPDR
ncbi:MFS transporter [Halocalculus aciditolerans]|uniref:Putative MFS-type transporter YfnC n=1 Tax=Halocalculus aciditolerans TaxID=1383812 RepID=A0A830F5M4_9EURY|nr:MFS transporter [Halocalculus aciditolerans]GGL65772.1 putative MFS-type transporter YfnC [Halocalculus aciditolerans]